MNKLTKVKAKVKPFEEIDFLEAFGIAERMKRIKKLEKQLEVHRKNNKFLYLNKKI